MEVRAVASAGQNAPERHWWDPARLVLNGFALEQYKGRRFAE